MKLIANDKLWRNFLRFSKFQLRSRDIDPVYPVLKRYYKLRELSQEERLWFTFIFCAYYDLGSAEIFFDLHPKPKHLKKELPALPTGVERRGMRGTNGGKLVRRHLNAVVLQGALVPIGGDDNAGTIGWTALRKWYETSFPFTGPWSSYKFADLMRNVHRANITAPDLGIGGGGKKAGPVPGLVSLTGRDWEECAKNINLQEDILHEAHRMKEEGYLGDEMYDGMEELETCLCDFNSATHGRYYVGHDIDQMEAQLRGAGASKVMFKARCLALDSKYLGEKNDWIGVRKHLNKLYVEKKKFIWW